MKHAKTVAAAIFSIIFMLTAPPAGASGRVFVDSRVEGYSILQSQIEKRLLAGDDVSVYVFPVGVEVDVVPQSSIAVVASGPSVWVATSGVWLPQVVADDLVSRVSVVARSQADRVYRLIREIHGWQEGNPKPAPPPAPPAPPGPPFDWGQGWLLVVYGICGLFVVLGTIVKVQSVRRGRKLAVLRRLEADLLKPVPDFDE